MIRFVVVSCVVVAVTAVAVRSKAMSDLCACCQTDERSALPKTETAKVESCDLVACTLAPRNMDARVADFEARLRPRVRETRELTDGFALRFDAEPETLMALAEWIAGESACCAFLDYQLTVHRSGGPIWFRMSGSEAAKDFLRPFVSESKSETGSPIGRSADETREPNS